MKERYKLRLAEAILGQEAICPKGLGRITEISKDFPNEYLEIQTYVDGVKTRYAPQNVKLVKIEIGTSEIKPNYNTLFFCRGHVDGQEQRVKIVRAPTLDDATDLFERYVRELDYEEEYPNDFYLDEAMLLSDFLEDDVLDVNDSPPN